MLCMVFFCKQKTAYEMRISDWSSDVCSSDLRDQSSCRFSEIEHQCLATAREARGDGADRHIEYLRRLAIGIAFDEHQHHDFALLVRKPGHRTVDIAAQRTRLEQIGRAHV